MLETSQVRVEGSKIHSRDFPSVGQGFKDKSLVQSTSEGSQSVKE